MYFVHEPDGLLLAKRAALYAAFIAEYAGAFVAHAHQTIIRVCYRLSDWTTIEASVLRLIEYEAEPDSPDPALERDVIELLNKSPIDETLKARLMPSENGT